MDFVASSPAQELVRVRRGAAALSHFDPNALLDVLEIESERRDELARVLWRDCSSVFGHDKQLRWQLKDGVRRHALQGLDQLERRELVARVASMVQQDPAQLVLTKLLLEDSNASDWSTTALPTVKRVMSWLPPELVSPSFRAEVFRRLTRDRLLAPFHELADEFVGRERELAALGAYLDRRIDSKWRRIVASLFIDGQKKPLFVYGSGGVGKSSLLSKFILDNASFGGDHLPFVYLNLDRPELLHSEPLWLLHEAVAQLSAQYTAHEQPLAELMLEWSGKLTELAASNLSSDDDARDDFFRHFAGRALSRISEGKPLPVLFVIDTFELAQYQGIAFAYQMFWFVEALAKSSEVVRVVLSGREPPPKDFAVTPIQIGELSLDAATAFVTKELEARKLDVGLAAEILRTAKSHPLSLRLALDLVGKNAQALQGVRPGLLQAWLRDTKVEGVLYRRVLDHIADPEVRKLAHPGLAVRRITSKVIQEVLAEPCGLGTIGQNEADELMPRLMREGALVTVAEDGSLWHRQDVRELMLESLFESRKEDVLKIHKAAVRMYSGADDDIGRAEEIYHRLWLDQDDTTISARWRKSLGPHLARSVNDYFDQDRRAYLRSLIDGTRAELPALMGTMDLRAWEQVAATEVEAHLAGGRVARARELLGAKPRRSSDSPLHVLDVRAMQLMGSKEQAAEHARSLLDRSDIVLSRLSALEISLAAVDGGTDADQRLRQLRQLAEASSALEISQDPRLFRRLAAALGRSSPTFLAKVLRHAGLSWSTEAAAHLGDALAPWLADNPELASAAEVIAGQSKATRNAAQWVIRFREIGEVASGELLSILFEQHAPPEALTQAVCAALEQSDLARPMRRSGFPTTENPDFARADEQLVGRHEAQVRLRELLQGVYNVVIVDGPPGSGRSAMGHFLMREAEAIGIETVFVSAEAGDPIELLVHYLGWNSPPKFDPDATPQRRATQLSSMIVGRLEEAPRRTILIFDDCRRYSPEYKSFLAVLARDVDRAGSHVGLLLLDYATSSVVAAGQRSFVVYLGELTASDVREYLFRHQLPGDTRTADVLLEQLGPFPIEPPLADFRRRLSEVEKFVRARS